MLGSGLVNVASDTLAGAVWIDLFEPTPAEEQAVEAQCGVDVPTREEMREIESSNRLYEEEGAVYLTSTIVTKLDTDLPQHSQITFILKNDCLITNRYTDPLPFRRYISYAERHAAIQAPAFVQQASTANLTNEVRTRLRTLSRGVIALSDHASFLGSNVSFILDATLGMINIDQNNILKIFSVVTVVMLPPSVIGAIYGMNFQQIPWLHESWGFTAALGLMVASAVIPYVIFKRRGWL